MGGRAVQSSSKKFARELQKAAKAAEKRQDRLSKDSRNLNEEPNLNEPLNLSPEKVNIDIDASGKVIFKESTQRPGKRER